MNLKIEDYFVALVDGFATFGALKAVPGLKWYSWILPAIFILLGAFYFWGKFRYDGASTKDWGDPDQQL